MEQWWDETLNQFQLKLNEYPKSKRLGKYTLGGVGSIWNNGTCRGEGQTNVATLAKAYRDDQLVISD